MKKLLLYGIMIGIFTACQAGYNPAPPPENQDSFPQGITEDVQGVIDGQNQLGDPGSVWTDNTKIKELLYTYGFDGVVNGIIVPLETHGKDTGYLVYDYSPESEKLTLMEFHYLDSFKIQGKNFSEYEFNEGDRLIKEDLGYLILTPENKVFTMDRSEDVTEKISEKDSSTIEEEAPSDPNKTTY